MHGLCAAALEAYAALTQDGQNSCNEPGRRACNGTGEIPPLGYASVGMTCGGVGPETLAARIALSLLLLRRLRVQGNIPTHQL